jgi:uncharacterized membrane protein (UPF0127 family)
MKHSFLQIKSKAGYVLIFSFCIFLCFFGFWVTSNQSIEADTGFLVRDIKLEISNEAVVSVRSELALTHAQRAQGLMFRHELPQGHAMLFFYDPAQAVKMWMHNTFIPLDMIFFDTHGRGIYVHENAQPHDETPIGPLSSVSVAYVLEVPEGFIRRHGIMSANQIKLMDVATLSKNLRSMMKSHEKE